MTEYKIVGTVPNLRIITTPANGTWLPAPLYVLAYNEGDTVAGMNTYRRDTEPSCDAQSRTSSE